MMMNGYTTHQPIAVLESELTDS